jgi:hypothetical protein
LRAKVNEEMFDSNMVPFASKHRINEDAVIEGINLGKVLGKKLLKDWFLAPITDRISLEER